jgi:beta-glucanase (GH16 family)
MTNLSAPAGYSTSDLVFNDSFSGTSLDSSWNPYITSNAAHGYPWNTVGGGDSGMGAQYNADYLTPGQISVNNGLTLTAIRQSISGLSGGSSVTFPVTSAGVSSYGKFEFDGGYLQISMKAPSGDGAWPSLWLLPGQGAGNSGDNFEIDMEEGGFTGAGATNDAMAYHLHTPSGTFGGVAPTGIDLTSGYNTYGIDWVPGKSITWYLNGKEIGQVTSAQTTIPSEPMEVILSNDVGNSNTSGWRTSLDSSTPASMAMQIADVQLYQTPGSGDTVTGANVTASSQPTTSVAPTISGTKANQTTTSEAPVKPFSSVTIADTNSGATDTLTITVGGAGGTLSGTGLSDGTGGVYTLSGTAAAITSELDALSFTPKAGAAGTSSTSTLSLSDLSSAFGTPAVNTTTSVVDTDPAVAPTLTSPTLSAQNSSLSVSPGGQVDLGLSVTTPDMGDTSVTITGLPKYELITDNFDNKTFSGRSVTLTAEEVDSGLTLHSYYHGHGTPVATLTATATDSLSGRSSASKTITVTDPPAQWNQSFALLSQHMASGFDSKTNHGQITTTSSAINSGDELFLAKPIH